LDDVSFGKCSKGMKIFDLGLGLNNNDKFVSSCENAHDKTQNKRLQSWTLLEWYIGYVLEGPHTRKSK
jgi:hypothetical protein